MVCRLALAFAVASLLGLTLTACGSDDDGSDKGGSSDKSGGSAESGGSDGTFDRPGVPFTFSYSDEYEVEPGTKPSLGFVRVGEFAEVSIRKSSDTPLARDVFLPQFKSDFESQGLKVSEPTTEKHSGKEMGVLEIDIPKGNPAFANRELHDVAYFFEVDGKLWQMQCIAPPDLEDKVRAACDEALATIKPK